jgi:hypothetical protein
MREVMDAWEIQGATISLVRETEEGWEDVVRCYGLRNEWIPSGPMYVISPPIALPVLDIGLN